MNFLPATASPLNLPFTTTSTPVLRPGRRIFAATVAWFARRPALRAAAILSLAVLPGHAVRAQTILGTTAGYALMAGSTVTINGSGTTVTGNLGVVGSIAGPGSNYSVTSGAVVTTTAQNQADFTRAFTGLAALTPTANLSGMVLGTTAGATTLAPGIYKFNSTAQLTGTLILDAQNQPNAVWVFQIGSTLTTAANANVTFANLAANSAATNGLFWQVGSTTVFGANTTFQGNVLSGTTIDFGAAVTIEHGRALTGSNTITIDGSTVNFIAADSGYGGGLMFTGAGNAISAVPEPATTALIFGSVAFGFACWRRRRARI